MESIEKKGFRGPRCCECGKDMPSQRATYETNYRLYCDRCKPIADVKKNWRPIGSGSVARIFVAEAKKNTLL